jgi:hypothetical protein
MRSMMALSAIVLLVACSRWLDPPEVTRCEKYVLSKLETPGTYKRTRSDSLSLGGYWEVGIEYSYDDRSGARVQRAWQICDYPIVNAKPDISKFLKLSGSNVAG